MNYIHILKIKKIKVPTKQITEVTRPTVLQCQALLSTRLNEKEKGIAKVAYFILFIFVKQS